MDYIWKLLVLLLVMLGHITSRRHGRLAHLLRITGYVSALGLLSFKDYFADALLVSSVVIGFASTVYSKTYSEAKYGVGSLATLVDLFNISMIITFAARDLLELVAAWFITELLGFVLVSYDYVVFGNRDAQRAALKYLLFSMMPSHISWFTVFALVGLMEACELSLDSFNLGGVNQVVLFVVLLGFLAKAAVFPLHFWLADAHSHAPSPASALLSGVSVKMGVYALYILSRSSDMSGMSVVLIVLGSVSSIYGSIQAIREVDIKRILAYSTISNTGILVVLTSLLEFSGDVAFLEAVILYSLAHALYKSALFLDSGFIELLAHRRNLNELGYIHRICPGETASALLATMSILGLPPSVGFMAGVFVFASISRYLESSWIYVFAMMVSSLKEALSIVYNLRYLRAHVGSRREVTGFDSRAMSLWPVVTALAVTPYVLTIFLALLDYKGFLEFTLIRREMPVLSVLVFIAISLFTALTTLFKEPGSITYEEVQLDKSA